MAILDGVIDEANFEPILGTNEEELRRRAARGPLRSGAIWGAKNISPLMNSGASHDERPILASSGTLRPKLRSSGIDGSPYARLEEAPPEHERDTPILGKRDGEPSEGILGRGADSRPRIPNASANTALPEPPILGASSASEPPGALGILGAQPQLPRLGFKERQALPTTSAGAPAGSAAFYRNAIERIEDQKANPWGSPENHPGALGKIGHILGRIGNIAGDITGYSAAIPGSDLNRELQERRLENRFETATNRENRATETEEQRRIEERRNEILDRRNDVLESKQPKLTPDEAAIADLQKQINPVTSKPYTSYEARVKLAQDLQDTKPDREPRTPNDFEQFYSQWLRDNQRPDTAANRLNARRVWEEAGKREPSDELTPAQRLARQKARNQAEREKGDGLRRAEGDIRKRYGLTGFAANEPWPPEAIGELEAAKQRVQDEYEAKLGNLGVDVTHFDYRAQQGSRSGGHGTALDRGNSEHRRIAAQILQEAGGDVNKARQIARQRGYDF